MKVNFKRSYFNLFFSILLILLYNKRNIFSNFIYTKTYLNWKFLVGWDFNNIYIYFLTSILSRENLMFNVIFYLVIFNYYFKISQEGVAANFKV